MKFIEGKKIYLRPYQETDLELVTFGKNNSEVRESLFLFAPMTVEQVKAEMITWTSSKEIALFTICEVTSNNPVGQTAFVRIDFVSRTAIFYLAIYDPNYWSKGFGTEATQLMIKYAFDILNLNRIQLHVSSENLNAIKAYKRVGFKIEGTLKEAMYHNNHYVDFRVMAILRQDYYKSLSQSKKITSSK